MDAAIRVRLGQSLRRLKELAPMAIALTPLLVLQAAAPVAISTCSDAAPAWAAWPSDQAALQALSQRLNDAVDAFGLRECHAWQPLVKGPEVCCTQRPQCCLLGVLTRRWCT